jgi:hypothetical protein
MRTFFPCPFCGSRRLTVLLRTERLTHKSCQTCGKLWAEPNVQAVGENAEADGHDGLTARSASPYIAPRVGHHARRQR